MELVLRLFTTLMEKFDEKRGTVSGWVNIEFEGDALGLADEAWNTGRNERPCVNDDPGWHVSHAAASWSCRQSAARDS